MFEVLNSYLFQHKSISIPGMGTIYMESLPASIDVSTKNMLPPLYYFRFDKYFDAPDKEFFSFLASEKKIHDFEALRLYNEFSFDLREKITHDQEVTWEGVGVLKKDLEGNIAFDSSLGNPFFLRPVPANQVIRRDAEHTMIVGDRERTNIEMNEWLQNESSVAKRISWWVYALVIACLTLGVLIYHFAYHGLADSSFGNQQKLELNK